jgi:hypothetical protein
MTWKNILKSDTINYDYLDKKEVENRVMEIVKGRGKLSTMYYDNDDVFNEDTPNKSLAEWFLTTGKRPNKVHLAISIELSSKNRFPIGGAEIYNYPNLFNYTARVMELKGTDRREKEFEIIFNREVKE